PTRRSSDLTDTVERIHQGAIVAGIQRYGHGVDGEVTPLLIVFQSTIFHHWLSRIRAIGFLSRADKLEIHVIVHNLRGTKIPEDADLDTRTEFRRHRLRQFDATPDTNKVNVLGWPLQQCVAHIAPDDVRLIR